MQPYAAEACGPEHDLVAHIAATNDKTLEQLCRGVQAEYGVQVGVTTMWKTLERFGLSLKKDPACSRVAVPGRSAGAAGLGQGAAQAGPASPSFPK